MKTIAVIKHFDVLDHITSRIVLSTINYIGSPFGFQTVKETLRNSIIPAIALSTHAADHAIDTQELPVITAGILAAAVRVVNQSLSRFPSPISHRKSIRDKRCLYPAAHSPTNNFSLIQIDYHRQIQPPFHGPQVGDIATPHGIGSSHLKISIQKIRRNGQVMLAVRRYSELLSALYKYASFFHQAAGTIPAHIMPLRTEAFGCSAGTIRTPGFAVDLPNY